MRRNHRNSELKKRALLAKQRMRMGLFSELRRERERSMEAALDAGLQPTERQPSLREVSFREVVRKSATQAAEDERLYQRICAILTDDCDTSNPIGRLIDHEIFDQLDSVGRQRYILKLAEKFRELSERFYAEHRAENN